MSRRPDCTSTTSARCAACSIGWSTPGTPWWSSSTISTSSSAPTGWWISGPGPATRAAVSLLGTILGGGFAAQVVGLVYTTPARSAFIVGISSVLAPLVAFLALRERTRWTALGALLIAAGGMYFLTAPDAGGLNRGDVWTLLTAVLFGGQIVAVAELSRRYDPGRVGWMQTAAPAVGAP